MTGNLIYLAALLGRRSFVLFCTVSLLVVALLAAVNIASHHALKEYVQDQLGRVLWDITAYQMTELRALSQTGQVLDEVPGISERDNIVFLRTNPTQEDNIVVDGEPLRSTWISVLSSTDMDMLPSEIRPTAPGKSILVLVGPKSQMGNAYAALQDRQNFQITVGTMELPVLDLGLERTVRVERNEINRWFLDQTNSPALIPEIGLVLVTPYDRKLLEAFDDFSRGWSGRRAGIELDERAGQYLPDLIHVLKIDRGRLISGWDIEGSLESLRRLQEGLAQSVLRLSPSIFFDNTTGVLLDRMNETARRVGLISLLVSLPLLWMGWVLMANLSRLLLLNERRKFGLMRLRGVSGRAMGQALLLSVAAGALVGGVLGGFLGTVLPILFYERGLLPLEVMLKVQQPYLLGTFIAIGLVISLLVSRRLVRYVSTISPLEASGRVASSEAEQANVSFGIFEGVALVLGSFKVIAWIVGFSLTSLVESPWVAAVDRSLDFVGFPLFVYGGVGLLASRRVWLRGALQMSVRAVGGQLRQPILQHISTRPHRIAGFLLIVALMTTISLYPTIMAAVFNNKIERGARVQLGSDIQVAINAADVISNELLVSGGLAGQYEAIDQVMSSLMSRVREVAGVQSATYMIEGVSEGVYVPGYGYNGLPIYLIPDAQAYLRTMYHEEQLTENGAFGATLSKLDDGQILLSPSVATYSGKEPGDSAPLGRSTQGQMLEATVAGTVRYLPGSPLASITDKDSFASARIDYVNHLFNNNAYIVANPGSSGLASLDVLVTGIHLAVDAADDADANAISAAISALLPAEPLAVRTFEDEMSKVGTDMYVFLARENVQVYLVGGLLLASIGILSIAYANYLEDRRVLGLLRVRGVGPYRMMQFFGSGLFAPSLIGLALGIAVSLVVGYGMTNLVWQLREVQNVLVYLSTHLAISEMTLVVTALIVMLLLLVGLSFSMWVFRSTARHSLSDA